MFKGNPVIASIAEHLIPATAAIVATRSDRSDDRGCVDILISRTLPFAL